LSWNRILLRAAREDFEGVAYAASRQLNFAAAKVGGLTGELDKEIRPPLLGFAFGGEVGVRVSRFERVVDLKDGY